MTKRILSLLLAGTLIFSLVPAQVLATDGAEDAAPSEEATVPTVMLMTDPANSSDDDDSDGDDDVDPASEGEQETKTWTVTFDPDDGSEPTTVPANEDGYVTRPEDPKDPNFVFGGWYTERGSEWNFDDDTVKGKDITLTAKWLLKVVFVTNCEATIDVQGVELNGTITAPENPNNPGYKLEGWYEDSTLTDKWDFANEKVIKTTTLYAKWIPQVTFVTGENGSKVDPYNIETIPSKVKVPAQPTHSKNLDFGGWYKDEQFEEEDKWDFTNGTVSNPITLYAKWNATVSFNTGADDCKIDSQTVVEGKTATEPEDPTRGKDDEYRFVGWYNGDSEWKFGSKVTENIALTAKWEAMVSFDAGEDATSVPAARYVVIGDKIRDPGDPRREGYVFDGWYTGEDPTNIWDFEKNTVSGPTTLHAKWLKKVKVSFDAGKGATYTGPAYVEVGEGKSIDTDIPSPSKKDFVFNGWYGPNGVKWIFDPASPHTVGDEDITLTAKWLEEFTVTFDSNGGKYTGPKEKKVGRDQTVSKPIDPTWNGDDFIFGGWYIKNADNEEVPWTFSTPVTAHITLFAKWSDAVTVKFETGTIDKIDPQVIEVNTKAKEPPTPQNPNYVFGGWYNGDTPWDFDDEVNEDITLTAKWNLKVTFYTRGGTPATIVQGVEVGKEIKLPAEPTRTGYVFGGWYKTDKIKEGDEWDFDTKIYENTDLYAKWDVRVKFDSTGGSAVVPDTVILDQGDPVEKPEDPEKSNYTFAGWYYKKNNKDEAWVFTNGVDSNITLTAKWDDNPLKISPISKELYPGETVTFTVKHKDEDVSSKVSWKIENATDSDTEFSGATLTIGKDEKPGTIKVTATYSGASNPDFALITIKPLYKFVSGTGSKWAQKSTKNLTFECNGPMKEISKDGIKIGSTAVKEENYTLSESVHGFKLVLKPAALKDLKVDKHTLTITFDDGGKAETTFEVVKESDIPETGDALVLPLWMTLMGITTAAALVLLKKRSL